jgi:hypothetical protein
MYTITLAITLSAVFLWFNTSKKVKFRKRPFWLEKIVESKKRTQILSLCLGLFSLVLTLCSLGFGAGIFAWLVYSMGLLSMVILLYPYQYIKYSHVIFISTFFLLVELTSYYFLLQ